MIECADAVVALGGDFAPDGSIGPASVLRMDMAIGLINEEVAPHLIVTGAYPYTYRQRPPHLFADLMRDYAIAQGVPEDVIRIEDQSRDTIGDALFTKVMFAEPNGWDRLVVVTSESHLSRAQHIFDHVMGPSYDIETVSAGVNPVRFHRIREVVGNVIMKAVLTGTEPGDTDAIASHLFDIIPGYREIPVFRRMLNLSAALRAS